MKNRLYILFSLVLCLLSPSLSYAQYTPVEGDAMYAFSWQGNKMLNNTDYIDNFSFLGFTIDGQYFVTDNLSVGGEFQWISYYQYKPRATYSNDRAAITTDLYNYVYQVPIMLTARYHFTGNERVLPYMGLSAGAMASETTTYFSIFEIEDDKWGFASQARLGTYFAISPSFLFDINAHYSFASNGAPDFGYNYMSAFGFEAGFRLVSF
jgi:outer membrane protein W